MSIINVESSYKTDAISSSDALGLMQLKLSTASDMAKSLNDSLPTKHDLFDVELNVKYGCAYLRYLLDYYDNNLINSLCAYNAGLGNVNEWLNHDNLDKGQTVKRILFEETDNYINKVNLNKRAYNLYKRLGKI